MAPLIRVTDLTVTYQGSKEPAIRKVSFEIAPGEFVLIAGDSASGKSTLMNAVCGFIPHIIEARKSGTVHIDGKRDPDPQEAALTIGMVHQDPEAQFCCLTVEEEVAFGPENLRFPHDRIEWAVSRSLGLVGAKHLRYRDLYSLSGGEKQKVAIASILALKPKVLVLDEPTSSLDHESIAQVLKAVRRIQRKYPHITTIILEHRVKEFKEADRLIQLEKGRISKDLRKGDKGFDKTMGDLTRPVRYPRPSGKVGKDILRVQGLSYSVGKTSILSNITFAVKKGSITALMGPNGSGKTTLLKHITGILPLQEGKITIKQIPEFGPNAGISTKGTDRNGGILTLDKEHSPPLWKVGRDVGMVFQNPNHQIFEDTIVREFEFGPVNYQKDGGSITSVIDDFLQSEQVSKDRSPHALSFGQKRRLNIGTSAAHHPLLLLLDEPFAGQDREMARKIVDSIRTLQEKGTTFIIVTHDPHFARTVCTDTIILKNGRIHASGDPLKVLEGYQ